MQRGEVCVAAIDLQSLSIVRPLQWNHRNWPVALTEQGLHPRRIVSQRIRTEQNHKGYPHQTEDTQLSDTLTFGGAIDDAEFYATLAPVADPSIDDLFAGNLVDGKYVVAGTRCRSLGSVLIQSDTMSLYAGYSRKLRVSFVDADTRYDIPVTDLSVLRAAEQGRVEEIKNRIEGFARAGKKAILRVGLARAWDGGDGQYEPMGAISNSTVSSSQRKAH